MLINVGPWKIGGTRISIFPTVLFESRSAIAPSSRLDAERRLESPKGAQDEIDKFCQMYVKGRAFARASGTEDAVRVYAEAHSKTEAEKLAQQVAEVVRKYGV